MKPIELLIQERGTPMTAAEARQLTDEALSPNDGLVASIVSYATGRIAKAAKSGSKSIPDPCYGLRNAATNKQIEAAYNQLVMLGYRVEWKTDEVQGRSWREVSW